MNQPDLFAPSIVVTPLAAAVPRLTAGTAGAPSFPRARRSDPRSSHDAAAQMEREGRAAHQSAQVLAAVKLWPNSTSHELAVAAHMDRYAIARRLSEIAAEGRIRRIEPGPHSIPCAVSGKRVCRWEAVFISAQDTP